MNVAHAFVQFMEDENLGTFGTDIFIGTVPLNASEACWWVLSAGGASTQKNNTGERIKNYILSVYYRNTDAEDVYNKLQDFEVLVNSKVCTEIANFATIEMEATVFPTDQDLDDLDRTIGLVEVTVSTYSNL